jgi:hypothetical protein
VATLLCNQYPALGVFNPQTGQWIHFQGGKLDIEEGDPMYETVMAEASRNPAIVVYANASTCVHCGETFGSKAKVEAHVKDVHFDIWIANETGKHAETINQEVKARSGHFCDACAPNQEFPDEEQLALHVATMHTAAPILNEDGSGTGEAPAKGGRKRPGEVDASVPAATAKG